MTSRLGILRHELARLRRVRAGLRAVAAWSALGTSVLLALGAVFVLDVVFHLAVPQRIVVLLLAGAAVGWAFWRFTRPYLRRAESEIEMALLVERQHRIDSDLVAALQFDLPTSSRWGSTELASAVVNRVSVAAPTINVFEGLPRKVALQRAAGLAACVILAVVIALATPGHAAAFFSRICLRSANYPTQTRIEQIVVNRTTVFSGDDQSLTPAECEAPQGRPLKFMVMCSGRLPTTGSVILTAADSSQSRTRLELRPVALDSGEQQVGEGGNTAVFVGELNRLNEDLTFKVSVGDARTEAARVRMIPLPIVELTARLIPPKYAADGAKTANSARQLAVIEGSSVEVTLTSVNQKPLQSAWLTVQSPGGQERVELTPSDSERLVWALPAGETPLSSIRRDLRYDVEVIDQDGLGLETALRGVIRIRPDQPPTSVAEVIHKVVLPSASPVVSYRATDDFGISRLFIIVDVERGGAIRPATPMSDESSTAPAAAVPSERHRFDIVTAREPITIDQLPLAGAYPLSLGPLNLVKGDRIKLTLEATDYRGENDQGQPVGQSAASDSLVLEISDESGVLSAISQPDQKSAEQLSEIIKRQLGIGEEAK